MAEGDSSETLPGADLSDDAASDDSSGSPQNNNKIQIDGGEAPPTHEGGAPRPLKLTNNDHSPRTPVKTNGIKRTTSDLVRSREFPVKRIRPVIEVNEVVVSTPDESNQLSDLYQTYKYSKCYHSLEEIDQRTMIGLWLEYLVFRRGYSGRYTNRTHELMNPHLTINQYHVISLIVGTGPHSQTFLTTFIDVFKRTAGKGYDRTEGGALVPFLSDLILLITLEVGHEIGLVNELYEKVLFCPIPLFMHYNFYYYQFMYDRELDLLVLRPRDELGRLSREEALVLFSEGMYRRRIKTELGTLDIDFHLFTQSDLLLMNVPPMIADLMEDK